VSLGGYGTNKTDGDSEFARVFGVDFASVMFRGSQFKVESFMFRIAKPESFVLVSPSKQQVRLSAMCLDIVALSQF
jgi:DNA polymerase elongation subunit (family B)